MQSSYLLIMLRTELSKLLVNLDTIQINLDSAKLTNDGTHACMGFWAGNIIREIN